MFYKTTKECVEFAEFLGFKFENSPPTIRRKASEFSAVRVNIANSKIATYEIANKVAKWFGSSRSCLLWITEFGVWPSSENLHLYYKLRSSYADHRSLADAPGHLFLSYESADLVTFIDLAIQFAWGGYLLGPPNHCFITISHDEWILVESISDIEPIISDIEKSNLPHIKLGLQGV
jgi:hypothetical protein